MRTEAEGYLKLLCAFFFRELGPFVPASFNFWGVELSITLEKGGDFSLYLEKIMLNLIGGRRWW